TTDCTFNRAQLREAAYAATVGLSALGLKRGDAMAVWLPNGPAWMQLLCAAAHLGVLVVPISTRYKAPEVRHLLEVSQARVIFTPRRFLETDYGDIALALQAELTSLHQVVALDDCDRFIEFAQSVGVSAAPEAGQGHDLMCCFSTSGTTGFPKLAAHDHASIVRHAQHVSRALDIRAADAVLCVLPLFGVFGFMTALGALAGRAACVLVPVFDASEAAHLIERHEITHVVGADAMFDAMLQVPDVNFSSLRHGVQADFVGLTLQVTERADALQCRFTGTYGSSGELHIRGPNVLAGYLNNPQATAKAFTEDGWFRTGDLAHLEGAGFVYLARMGDSLRLRGFLVNPAEIESGLMQHAQVHGAQVVGVNVPGEGDVAVAYVLCDPSATEVQLLAYCRDRMAGYKVPRRIIAIDAFPALNGPNGNKIQKRVLRDMARTALGL
ncbi:MAG: AMP-binding protein, partial [Burkholderiales bacterium]|nr:AMP-binding protein [Burkholderiales bacterium]